MAPAKGCALECMCEFFFQFIFINTTFKSHYSRGRRNTVYFDIFTSFKLSVGLICFLYVYACL